MQRNSLPLVAHSQGKLYWRRGRRQEAQEHLTTATKLYREMGMLFWLEKVEARAAEVGGGYGVPSASR